MTVPNQKSCVFDGSFPTNFYIIIFPQCFLFCGSNTCHLYDFEVLFKTSTIAENEVLASEFGDMILYVGSFTHEPGGTAALVLENYVTLQSARGGGE